MTRLLGRFAPLVFLLALMVVFSAAEPRFLSPLNLFNVMRQISITGLIALGMTFVILTGGIDLSVGSVVALAGLVAGALAKGSAGNTLSLDDAAVAGYPVLACAAAAGLVGLAAGLVQGLAITRLDVPPFVVTLGGLSAFRGAALLFSGGGPISGYERGGLPLLGTGQAGTSASAGADLPGRSSSLPRGSAPHPIWPARLRGGRQRGGGAAVRP